MKTQLKKIACFSKGQQINGEQLLSNGKYDYLNGGIYPSGKWSDYNVEGDTIAISEGGNSCGYVNYMESNFWCGGHCYYLYDVKCSSKYLYYALKSQQDRIMKLRSGACMPNIKKKDLADFVFEYNDNSIVQKKVVLVLDTLESVILSKQLFVKKLDELIKSRFVEMFGDPVINPMCWERKPFLQIGSCKNGMNFHNDESGVNIHCLGVGNFKDLSTIQDTSVLPIISLNEMPSDEYMLQNNDIVFVRSNGNKALVGRCLTVYPYNIPTTFSGFCIRFRIENRSVAAPYLLRVLKSDSIRNKIKGRGANIQNLNQKILSKLEIPIPPMNLQNQFADFVTQVEKQRATVQQSIDKLETLKKSLMQEYFG